MDILFQSILPLIESSDLEASFHFIFICFISLILSLCLSFYYFILPLMWRKHFYFTPQRDHFHLYNYICSITDEMTLLHLLSHLFCQSHPCDQFWQVFIFCLITFISQVLIGPFCIQITFVSSNLIGWITFASLVQTGWIITFAAVFLFWSSDQTAYLVPRYS